VQEAANLRARLLEELVEHYNLTSEKAKATLLLKLQKKEQEKDTFSRLAETRCTRTTNSSNMEEVPSKVHDTEKHSSTAFRHHAGISWSIRESNQELRANLRKQDEESSVEDASKDNDHESQQDDEESTTASQHGHNKPAIPFWAYIETLPA